MEEGGDVALLAGVADVVAAGIGCFAAQAFTTSIFNSLNLSSQQEV